MKSYYEIADIVYSNTIIATDADDVATMLIESEGNFNQAMVKSVNNMLRGAGVVPLDNTEDYFGEVKASLAQCKQKGESCTGSASCCEYK